MRYGYTIVVLAAVLPVAFLLAGDQKPKKQKKPKPPPDENEVLHKAVEKWSRPPKTERDKLIKDLEKALGEEGTLADPEAGDAEFHRWFDRLAGGRPLWREDDITHKDLRSIFRRMSERLGVTTGEINREQFLGYSRRYLAPGQSIPWKSKPPRNPLADAGKVFRKLDLDGDGFLDAGEMPPALQVEWRNWDGDGDGRIDEQEYARYFEARLRQTARERGTPLPDPPPLEAPDQERSGRPTVFRPGRLPSGLPAWFSQCDADGDAQVGLYEWKTSGRDVEEFLQLDLNRDGFLTVEEVLRVVRSSMSRGNLASPTRGAYHPW